LIKRGETAWDHPAAPLCLESGGVIPGVTAPVNGWIKGIGLEGKRGEEILQGLFTPDQLNAAILAQQQLLQSKLVVVVETHRVAVDREDIPVRNLRQ